MKDYTTGSTRKKKMSAKKRRIRRIRRLITTVFVLFIILVVVGVAALVIQIKNRNSIKSELTIEAGTEFDVNAYSDKKEVTFVSGEYDTHVPGSYSLIVSDGKEHEVTLKVVDTIAPVVVGQDAIVGVGMEVDPMLFAASIDDATTVTGALTTAVDTSASGVTEVEVVFTDLGGNTASVTATLVISDDDVPPVIACPNDTQINVGDSIIYGDLVSITDNEFTAEQCKLEIDKATVNVNEAGTYTVTFTATDPAGNSSSRSMDIIVIVPAYSQEQVDELADAVLAEIITDDMTDKEKAEAIYKWVNIDRHIGWYNDSEKDDWLKAAYKGFVDGRGDCFTYATVSQELLNRAGVKNMMIQKIPSSSRHYWNLVDYGEGWYHFDTTPRKIAHNFCLIGDDELMKYSEANKDSHHYDRANYPEINK